MLAEYGVRREIGVLRFHPGTKPAVFWIGKLTTTQYAQIHRSTTNEEGRYELAFLHALVKATDVPLTTGEIRGEFVPAHIRDPKPKQNKSLSTAEFDLFSGEHVFEIGRVALDRAPLVPGKPLIFGLPPTSDLALQKMVASYRLAAILNPGTTDSAPAPSDKATETSPPSTGEPPGDATATGSPETTTPA